MKTQFFLVAALVFAALSPLSAQFTRVDVFLSPGLMTIKSNPSRFEAENPKISLGGGVGTTYSLSKHFVINAQLLYERKGAKGSQRIGGGSRDAVPYLRLNTISIPLTLGYEFGDKIRMQVAGGVFVGYFVSESISYGEVTDDVNDIRNTDFGLSLAYIVYIPVNEKIDIRIGIQDNIGINQLAEPVPGTDVSLKTNALNFQLGASFKF